MLLAVYHARGLKNTQHIGKQDPYVEITCGTQTWQSEAHRGTPFLEHAGHSEGIDKATSTVT